MWVICSSWCCWSLSRERGGAGVSLCCSAWLVPWGGKQGRQRVSGVLCTAWFHSGLSDLSAFAGNSWIHTRGWSGCLKEHVKILLKMLTGWFQIDLAYCSVLNSWLKLLPSLLAYILTVAGLTHHVCIAYSAIRSSSLHRLLCNLIFTAPILW